MRLPLFIAFRYLFSKKKVNAINVITGIAMLGFGVGAFAMIVILSTLNGFEKILELTINKYDPEITITSSGQKIFYYNQEIKTKLTSHKNVQNVAQALEEKVVVKYNQHQEIGRIKGVSHGHW